MKTTRTIKAWNLSPGDVVLGLADAKGELDEFFLRCAKPMSVVSVRRSNKTQRARLVLRSSLEETDREITRDDVAVILMTKGGAS